MTTVINGQGNVEYTDNELVKEMIDKGDSTAAKNFVLDPETKKMAEDLIEEYRVDKRLLQELKRALEFCAPFQNFAITMDISDKNEPTLLGVHPDSGSSFNVYVKKSLSNDEFVYNLYIAINEVPMIEGKPNTLATNTYEYAHLTYRELGLVLNHPVTLNRLSQRTIYGFIEDDFVKGNFGRIMRR